jgi:hypothetical protein
MARKIGEPTVSVDARLFMTQKSLSAFARHLNLNASGAESLPLMPASHGSIAKPAAFHKLPL